jgi:hypothetical protein
MLNQSTYLGSLHEDKSNETIFSDMQAIAIFSSVYF